MGSDGDNWDGKIVLPLEPRELLEANSKSKVKRKSGAASEISAVKLDEVRFLRYKPPLHALVYVSWALAAMAATTEGEALPWRSALACGGILAAALVPMAIGWSKRLTGGKVMALISGAACVALLAWTYAEVGWLPFPGAIKLP